MYSRFVLELFNQIRVTFLEKNAKKCDVILMEKNYSVKDIYNSIKVKIRLSNQMMTLTFLIIFHVINIFSN